TNAVSFLQTIANQKSSRSSHHKASPRRPILLEQFGEFSAPSAAATLQVRNIARLRVDLQLALYAFDAPHRADSSDYLVRFALQHRPTQSHTARISRDLNRRRM